MVRYDADVIVRFAEALYARARRVVIEMTLLGVFVGAVIGAEFSGAVASDAASVMAVIGGVLGGIGGYVIGRSGAFVLQLLAQTALCQVAIEANTRGAAGTSLRAVGGAPPSA